MSDDNIPPKTPKIILIIQLIKAINRVSFNLVIAIFKIWLLIFGVKADLIKSKNSSNPPIWKSFMIWWVIGKNTNMGRKLIKVWSNFNFCNLLINKYS